MNNFVEHTLPFALQADADNALTVALDTAFGSMTLVSVMARITAVAGTPTGVTVDVDITDGTITRAAIAAQSIGTAAGTLRLIPTSALAEAGDDRADLEDPDGSSVAFWRADIDFNFTGGTTPTVSGVLTLRWAL